MKLPRKKSLLFFAASMGIFFVGLLVLLLLQGRSARPLRPAQPTIMPVTPSTTKSGIRVLSTKPRQNELVPIATDEMKAVFSNSIENKALRVTLFEELTGVNVAVNTTLQQNTATVEIQRPLAPNSGYIATFRLVDGGVFNYELRFRTEKGEPVDTYPIGLPEKTQELDLKYNPDIFLANKLPYENASFSMDRTIQDSGKIIFTVRSGTPAEVKLWLVSLGLTEKQIESLTIQYIQ